MSAENEVLPFDDADISQCGYYRYWLTRHWADGDMIAWVMLNPSTADANKDDPTIRRCIDFSKRWGYGGLVVLNLFSLRATSPKELEKARDPYGPRNRAAIAHWLFDNVPRVVVAWGSKKIAHRSGTELVFELRQWGVDPLCLGVTKDGMPKHPLYLKANTTPVPFDFQATRMGTSQ